MKKLRKYFKILESYEWCQCGHQMTKHLCTNTALKHAFVSREATQILTYGGPSGDASKIDMHEERK